MKAGAFSLTTKNKVIAGATLLLTAGGLVVFANKIFGEGDKQIFRSIQNLKTTYEVNPQIVDELNALHEALDSVLQNGTLSDVSGQANTLKKLFEVSNLKTFTQNLQAIANLADDLKNEWINASAEYDHFMKAWQKIQKVLNQMNGLLKANQEI